MRQARLERRGALLDRERVAAGFIVRWRAVLAGTDAMLGDLPGLLAGKTKEEIRLVLGDRIEGLRTGFLATDFSVMKLPPEAQGTFDELVSVLREAGER